MATKQIELPRPHSIEDLENLKSQAYREGVLDLVRQSKIPVGDGAALLGMSEVDFLELMKRHGIPMPPDPNLTQSQSARPIWEIAEEISASVPDEEWAKVPADLSKNFKHYLYGAPKESE